MNVSFYTLGCKLNYSETSALQSDFENNGFSVVPFGEKTDVVIINTCTVTENADKEARQIVRRALRTSPNAYIAVTGCYAQLQPEEIASIDGVSAVFGTKEKMSITRLAGDFTVPDSPQIYVSDLSDADFQESQSSEHDSRTRAFLKIQDGCNYKCSFCTIPQARGASRSMPFETVLSRISELESEGFHEIILAGINLGDYATASGENFTSVITSIENRKPNVRVRISSVEPNLLTQEVIETVASSKIFVPHFHIPLQSGSPEILRLMRRRYKTDYYKDLIERIKKLIPDCGIGVDVIVGFPGETDEHFEETYSFLHSLPVSYLHVFTYSERENTPAAEFADRVPISKRKERTTRLRALSAKKKFEFYRSEIGKKRYVIPESYNAEEGGWIGYSDNYIRTVFSGPHTLLQKPILIELNETDGDVMRGSIAEPENISTDAGISSGYIPIMLS